MVEAQNRKFESQAAHHLQQLKQLRLELLKLDEIKLSLQKEQAAKKVCF
jgi:hypothetical protein